MFTSILAALLEGNHICHSALEKHAVIFMEGDEVFYQRNPQSQPVPYQFDGRDLKRSDWRVVEHEKAIQRKAV